MKRRRFIATAGALTTIAKAAGAGGSRAKETDGDPLRKAIEERKGSLKGLPEPIVLPRRTMAGLEPYSPSTSKPWDRQRAGYLLRRTMFGAKKADVDLALTKSPGEIVDTLLEAGTPPSAPGSWVSQNYFYNSADDSQNRTNMSQLLQWWTGLMINQELSIREKMVFFWHDHWATESMDVIQPQFNYSLLDLFRKNHLGNFRQMVKDVTISPAMLVYLDGRYNTKGRPNENYAREQMELHMLGEGNGYTEDDVKASARAHTGWSPKQMGKNAQGYMEFHPSEAVFTSANFDSTSKTFMGQTGNWGYTDIADIIFTQRKTEAAHFICRKLYRAFVYEIADETIVNQLADLLIANDWSIAPVMSTLLKSEHFFDVANIGAHITSPLEFLIGAVRSLEIQTTAYADVFTTCAALGLQLLQPPNVKGWPEYRTWITASRLAARWNATDLMIDDGKKTTPKFALDPVAFVTRISEPSNARRICNDIIALLLDLPLNTYQTDVLLEKFLSGWRDYEWDISNPGAVDRLRGLFKAVLRASEAHLI
jgi:uncharacterized protein (DUF1800 family)